MAYVRRRGNQLALVHGERDAHTGAVQQRILFTRYFRPEALEALGRSSKGGGDRFRRLLEEQYPVRRWHEQHRTGEREAFDRMQRMRSREFAEAEAGKLGDLVGAPRVGAGISIH